MMSLGPISMTMAVLMAAQDPGARGGWSRVQSIDGGFSVTVPGKVEQKTQTNKTEGGPAEVHAILAESGGVVFLSTETLSPTRITADKQAEYFDKLRETYAAGKGNTLQKEQRGTFQGMPMCYFRFATADEKGRPMVVQARFLVADPTHLYSLQVFIPKGVDVNADVKRFFESLKRTEPGVRPASKEKAKNPEKADGKGSGVGPPIAAKWRPFSPLGHGFTITMPGEPVHNKQDAPDGSIKIDTYPVDLGDRLYSVVCYEFPASVASQVPGTALDNLCKGLATGVKGSVVELKPIRGDGLEGREVLFEFAGPDQGKPAIGRVRAYLVGTKAYVLMYNGAKGTGDGDETRKFLDSFRLVRSPSPSTGKGKAKARP